MTLPELQSLPWPASPWVQGPAAFLLWTAALFLARAVLLGTLRRVAARTRWEWDDVVVQALSPALTIAILASGLVILGRILPLSPEWDGAFAALLAAAVALALVVFVDRACRGILARIAERSAALQGARGLIQGIVRGLIIGLGLLIFLDSVGISITPLLASLGVGSLAVALALQDTLANMFAGIHLVMDKPIEAGHFIRLEGGEEGFVTKVGWRSTRIRTRSDNVVVVPNTKLAGSVITNYYLPGLELAVTVRIGVHYDSDLERVERVAGEVAREVMQEVSGGVPGFQPFIRFHTFAESSIDFSMILRCRDFESHNLVVHEFIKRLQARFRREGIVLPYPIRTLDLPAAHLREARDLFLSVDSDERPGAREAGGR